MRKVRFKEDPKKRKLPLDMKFKSDVVYEMYKNAWGNIKSGSAGIDLITPYDFTIEEGQSMNIDTGLAVAIPKDWYGQVSIRSGLGSKGYTMLNGVGIVDFGYQGFIRIFLARAKYVPYEVTQLGLIQITEKHSGEFKAGDRIAQMVVSPHYPRDYNRVLEWSYTSERGTGGFGSSGQ